MSRTSRRTFMFTGAGVLASGALAHAQRRFRFVPAASGGGGGSRTLLTQSDLTYQGMFYCGNSNMDLPSAMGYFGNGITLRTESSDTGNTQHIMSGVFQPGVGFGKIAEMRMGVPSLSSPPNATIVKEYSEMSSGKRVHSYNGGSLETFGNATDGGIGCFWDAVDSRLYQYYGETYNSTNTFSLFYTDTLNYAAGTGVGHGPWSYTNWGFKMTVQGMCAIPSAWATTYASGRRLGVGSGGYTSLLAQGGNASLGPALTAIAPVSASEQTALANTPLVGYNVGSTSTYANRPTSIVEGFDGGTTSKWTWVDRVGGVAWIDTGTKHGVVFICSLGQGVWNYLSSDIAAQYWRTYALVYDPADLALVATGMANPWDIQPNNTFEIGPNTGDPTYGATTYGTGVSLQSSAVSKDTTTSSGGRVNLTAHGRSTGDVVAVLGSSRQEYNAIWKVGDIVNANQFVIYNSSLGGDPWSGISATGATITSALTSPPHVQGVCTDGTSKLYALIDSGSIKGIHVWNIA